MGHPPPVWATYATASPSCHCTPSICSLCSHLPVKLSPVYMSSPNSPLAKFNAGEDFVLVIYDLSFV